ncbi:MAG: cation:proton antiporter [Nevskiaceae bacterium]|nr:MAG: cation:proton antiporter [Nevskiaceae bacterium]TBR72738.1 MAG: cation:proton antiporter [Nevskiaceae bacterium]
MTEPLAEHANILFDIFVMLAAAKLFDELCQRLKQPTVVGGIFAGFLIGPSVLGWVAPSAGSSMLAEIGVVILMFSVGLETKLSTILSVGRTALAVAVLGVVVPFAAGWWLLRFIGESQAEALFVGTAMVATSVGITAHVLAEMGVLATRSARIILGAAVIDDVLGLLLLAAVSSAAEGPLDWAAVGSTAAAAIAFVIVIAALGPWVVARTMPFVQRQRAAGWVFSSSLVLCFALAAAADHAGVASIVGAFLAGMALAEFTSGDPALHRQMHTVGELLVPFFLVTIGMQLKLDVFAQPETLWLAGVLTLLAIAGKLVGCGVAALHYGWREAVRVGVGMVPRGEVGIIVAQIGLAAGIVSQSLFGAVLVMVIVTTVIAPPALKPLFRNVAH